MRGGAAAGCEESDTGMTIKTILGLVLLPPLAYALGSIPFGLLVARVLGGPDLRRSGSGNIGATNVRRSLGNGAALLTLAGDVLKGALPLWLAQGLLGSSPGTLGQCHLAAVGLGAFLGHLYPVYLGGRGGGKGVATAGGAMAVLAPAALATALLVFIMVACWSNRASLASLAAAAYLPLGVWLASHSGIFTAAAGLMAVLIAWRHRDNLHRLGQGSEPRIWPPPDSVVSRGDTPRPGTNGATGRNSPPQVVGRGVSPSAGTRRG